MCIMGDRVVRGWKFDEIGDKSSSTEKPNFYRVKF